MIKIRTLPVHINMYTKVGTRIYVSIKNLELIIKSCEALGKNLQTGRTIDHIKVDMPENGKPNYQIYFQGENGQDYHSYDQLFIKRHFLKRGLKRRSFPEPKIEGVDEELLLHLASSLNMYKSIPMRALTSASYALSQKKLKWDYHEIKKFPEEALACAYRSGFKKRGETFPSIRPDSSSWKLIEAYLQKKELI